jgi:hypothetical protein
MSRGMPAGATSAPDRADSDAERPSLTPSPAFPPCSSHEGPKRGGGGRGNWGREGDEAKA